MSLILGRPRPRPALLCVAAATLVAGAASLPQALGSPAHGATQAAQDSRAAVTGSRPFRPTGYWNTGLGQAPLSSHSSAWIADSLDPAHTQNYLKLVLGDWGMPVFHSDESDPLYRVTGNGRAVSVHIPARAQPMATNDAAMTVIDRATNQVVGLGGARFANGQWTAAGVSRYGYRSNGIAGGLPGGRNANYGHRGIPASVAAVTMSEIRRGQIRHRLEVYWWETASSTPEGASAYFPMTGSESGQNGVVPEGAVVRIKPSVDLDQLHLSPAAHVIARALQQYGAVVGDNSGSGNNLKLQANVDWTGILNKDSLKNIPWSDFVFVEGGYRP